MFQDKIEVSRAISILKYLTRLMGNSSKVSMKNDMLDFNVIKFFYINTRTVKVFLHQVGLKLTLMGAVKGYPGLATCESIFRGSMGEFIGVFSAFLEIQTTLVAEFYGVIHSMEEA